MVQGGSSGEGVVEEDTVARLNYGETGTTIDPIITTMTTAHKKQEIEISWNLRLQVHNSWGLPLQAAR